MKIYVGIVAHDDVSSVTFELKSAVPGWKFTVNPVLWSGGMRSGQRIMRSFEAVPTVAGPGPLSGTLRVSGWPDTAITLDLGRLGGNTPETEIELGGGAEAVRSDVGEVAPATRPDLPAPPLGRPEEPWKPWEKQAPALQEVTEPSVKATVRAYGRFVYKDDANVTRGVRHALVKVMDSDTLSDDTCAEGLTDVNGNFNLTGSCGDAWPGGGPDVYVKVYALSAVGDVKPGSLFAETYSYQTGKWDNFGGGSINVGTRTLGNAGAWHLFSRLTEAWQYMRYVGPSPGETVPKVTVKWPNSNWANYNGDVNIPSNRTWREDTFYHEYGHHVLYKLAQSPSPDYNNGICDDPDPGHCLWSPEKGYIGWTEGWPNFFSQVNSTYYNTNDIRNFETHVDDSRYTAQRDHIEGFIAAVLWDIYDSASDDQHGDGPGRRDASGNGFNEQWDVVRHYDPAGTFTHPVTIHDFFNGMVARHSTLQNQVSEIYMEHHLVKPQPNLVVYSLSNPPTSIEPGQGMTVTTTVKNSGNQTKVAGSFNTRIYVSTNSTITTSDTILGNWSTTTLLGVGGTTSNTANYIIPNALKPGTYYLGACTDHPTSAVPESNENDNCRASTTTVTVPDKAGPTVTITSPTSGTTYSTSSSPLKLSGTASDNVAATQVGWSSSRGGAGICSGTAAWSCANIALLSGTNVLTVTARDAAGNTGTDVLTVTYTPPADVTPPTVTISSPTGANTYATNVSPLNLGGSASDNLSITSVTWSNSAGGSGNCAGTDSWTCSGIGLLPGTNVLTVTASDPANNHGTDVLTVTYTPPPADTEKPSVVITRPTTRSVYYTLNSSALIGGTATDNVGVTRVDWRSDRGGSGACTGTTSWDCPAALFVGRNVLTITASDASGNEGTDTLTVIRMLRRLYRSVNSQDGWILESTENSGLGKYVNSAEAYLRVGDDAYNRQYRSILSFNTKTLPVDAKIVRASVQVRHAALTGTSPFKTHGKLLLDIRSGVFSRYASLEPSDFQAAGSLNEAGVISAIPSGGWYRGGLKSSALRFINRAGLTQFRLRFQLDDNNDRGADYLRVFSGDTELTKKPILSIDYY